ncbi:MAG: hypothetical protein OQK71_10630 [Desulfobacter sp.]|uniref:hypothetical protein n=1 Tax=uncultured Desulfobacter sp. TaxID=240139 RepID=UPI003747F09A|nr:hypothetical protein [Desulfobacter sp.]
MTGISEILLLIFLILCILIVPRIISPKPPGERKKTKPSPRVFTIKLRSAIVLSAAIIIISALWTKPWQGQISMFIVSGILPVALGWSLVWIFSAQKK